MGQRIKVEGKFLIVEEDNWINSTCEIILREGENCLARSRISTASSKWVFDRIFVDEEHRAKGYGSEVLCKLTDYLDRKGLDLYAYIHATGSLDNRQLLAWYKRHGFVKSGDGSYPLVRIHRNRIRY